MQFTMLLIGSLFTLIGLGMSFAFFSTGEVPLFACLLPLIFTVIGLAFLFSFFRKKLRAKKLKETGRQLRAVITNVSPNYSVTINGRHPYLIDCEYNGLMFQADYMKAVTYDMVGKTVTVYVSEEDPSKYFVDTSEL